MQVAARQSAEAVTTLTTTSCSTRQRHLCNHSQGHSHHQEHDASILATLPGQEAGFCWRCSARAHFFGFFVSFFVRFDPPRGRRRGLYDADILSPTISPLTHTQRTISSSSPHQPAHHLPRQRRKIARGARARIHGRVGAGDALAVQHPMQPRRKRALGLPAVTHDVEGKCLVLSAQAADLPRNLVVILVLVQAGQGVERWVAGAAVGGGSGAAQHVRRSSSISAKELVQGAVRRNQCDKDKERSDVGADREGARESGGWFWAGGSAAVAEGAAAATAAAVLPEVAGLTRSDDDAAGARVEDLAL